MLGGTPCNQALTLVNEKVHLIVGMNLPMILELLGMRETQPAEVSAAFCPNCGMASFASGYSLRMRDGFVLIEGRCATCGAEIARLCD